MIYLATHQDFDGIMHYFYKNNDIIAVHLFDFMDYDETTDYFGYRTDKTYYVINSDILIFTDEFVYEEYLPEKLRYVDICDIENVLEEMILKKL